MARTKLPVNDGWNNLDYDVGLEADGNGRVSRVLNEACHVFHAHAGGTWKALDKDAYARRLAAEIRPRRSIIKALLHTDDRVVKSVTYRAIELLEAEAREGGTSSP